MSKLKKRVLPPSVRVYLRADEIKLLKQEAKKLHLTSSAYSRALIMAGRENFKKRVNSI
jgi:hypothetical protein